MLPYAHSNHGTDFVFQQDNASIHASRETKSFLAEMEVNTMVWPARSPDCNPIENVWSVLADRFYAHGRQYRTIDQLEGAILVAWDSIDQEYLLKLVESMPRCHQAERRSHYVTGYSVVSGVDHTTAT
ncbi:Transposase [Phytophthora palmivora]|uniref:Transposase n=1 Tax=Phytophthora palmivora TaxID=4796 RepID=A0A2P4YTK6_9STRA|nr:Transposase [Phytophthora palmivora]